MTKPILLPGPAFIPYPGKDPEDGDGYRFLYKVPVGWQPSTESTGAGWVRPRGEPVSMSGYGVIYADPPWTFKTHSDKGKGRSAEAHYDCLSLPAIKRVALQLDRGVCAEDCVLLMWVTDPFLQKGFEVIEAWGFQYKTVGFYWAKTNGGMGQSDAAFPMGTGYWTRANPEQCLLATRGHPKRLNADVRKLIVSPRREHSCKPDEAYERIERLCAGPYLELFARQRRPGWDAWGLEADTGPGERRWGSGGGPDEK